MESSGLIYWRKNFSALLELVERADVSGGHGVSQGLAGLVQFCMVPRSFAPLLEQTPCHERANPFGWRRGCPTEFLSINPCFPKPSLWFAPIQKERRNRESWCSQIRRCAERSRAASLPLNRKKRQMLVDLCLRYAAEKERYFVYFF
ncbi:hypothetical protein A7K93_02955 [Candidatus Methylacidiphilum fumarolicum]|nr:hypothetical protein A7K73_00450 [Candidatus Methylacidiphilum fumarolicum]TFE74890.1 hypothetical protein A7K93_02955 [Candidatus Methylacidiphilum fumarolicum]TFE75535.1 hypothetical protein A7K72_01745 [Candidatus Methylacidiphilum fumarolicum]TFE77955.1 hypothetical protein A7D33_00095 [Candidatus Methylacidiphilum fumarolicum]